MRKGARTQGFVLVTVIGLVAMLTVITIGFGHRALLDRRAAVSALDHARAAWMARGAVELGIAELQNSSRVRLGAPEASGESAHPLLLGEIDAARNGRFFRVFSDPAYEQDSCGYIVEDEERRISINAADEAVLEQIEGLRFTVVGDILRRRDRGTGSEQKTPFLAVEEVVLLRDVTDAVWNGSGGRPPLRDLLTIWGDGRVNLNTASEAVLQTIPGLDPPVLNAILTYRNGPDGTPGTSDDRAFANWPDIARAANVSAERIAPLEQHCKLESEFFTITGFATTRQGKVRAFCQATITLQEGTVSVLQWREGALGS